MCRADSIVAQQVCDVYAEAQNTWETENAAAEAATARGYEYERSEVDAVQTQLKATLTNIAQTRSAIDDTEEGEERTIMEDRFTHLRNRLAEDRERVNAAKERLVEAKELCPVTIPMANEEIWEHFCQQLKAKCVQLTAETELDRLKALNKRRKETWLDSILRFQQAAPYVAPSYTREHTRILLGKLPPQWQAHVVGQDPSTNLDKMVQIHKNTNF